jgi:tRNA pseudouridine32 synthase/23S rRNA pseudouridine746 synthase
VAEYIGGKAYLVHRLDRETSGVMVFARTADSHRRLSQQFESRAVTKRYVALVSGQMDTWTGEIAEPLREFGSGRVGVDPNGKSAVTGWQVRERLSDNDLLDVSPITGRRHQIRVHLYSIGHPILGDSRYGDDRPIGGAPRLMLHASELTLPAQEGPPLVLRADPPAEFTAIVESYRSRGAADMTQLS